MIAYVMVDLLQRIGRFEQALGIASQHLKFVEDQSFSYADLCNKAGNQSAWADAAKERGDLVGFTAALSGS